MNDNTQALIRELAEKLGTTGEHLWGVLLRQAPITGAIDLLIITVWAAVVIWALCLVKTKTTQPKPTDDDRYNDRYTRAEWRDEGAFFAWAVWTFMATFFGIHVITSLSCTVAALVNPEYWALKQVLP